MFEGEFQPRAEVGGYHFLEYPPRVATCGRILALVFAASFFNPCVLAQQSTPVLMIRALLSTKIDSKKLHPGDPLEAIVSMTFNLPDTTVVPKKSKLIGHVVASTAKSRGDSQSSLESVFDRIEMPGGKRTDISAKLQAVGTKLNVETAGEGGHGTLIGLVADAQLGGPASPATILDAQSTGVHGIAHLYLNPEGILSSDDKAVKIDTGSQLIVRATLAK
jgi:hypothetical protein